MFEEKLAEGESELLPFSHVSRDIRPREAGAGLLHGVGETLGYIRGLIKDNEELIVLAVVLLMLCDCDDDTELLIALALMFFVLK